MNLQRAYATTVNRPEGRAPSRRAAFTLIELILVMAILAAVIAYTAPTLTKFFRGRTLDSEVNRFIAMTRYAQSRAVSEGIPMMLWIDTQERAFGVVMQPSYSTQDDKAQEFALDGNLTIEVGLPPANANINATAAAQTGAAQLLGNNVTVIRYTPDGFISQSSPETITIRDGETEQVVIAQSRTRLNYEVQANIASR